MQCLGTEPARGCRGELTSQLESTLIDLARTLLLSVACAADGAPCCTLCGGAAPGGGLISVKSRSIKQIVQSSSLQLHCSCAGAATGGGHAHHEQHSRRAQLCGGSCGGSLGAGAAGAAGTRRAGRYFCLRPCFGRSCLLPCLLFATPLGATGSLAVRIATGCRSLAAAWMHGTSCPRSAPCSVLPRSCVPRFWQQTAPRRCGSCWIIPAIG